MPEECFDTEQMKLEFNTLVWMKCPGEMTLREADKLACSLLSTWEKHMASFKDFELAGPEKGATGDE